MTNYHPLLRANKGQAPTAGQFNRLAENLEKVQSLLGPRFFLARKSGNQTVTIPATGLPQTVTFNTETHDTASMFSAGTITIPTDATLIRIVCNLYFSTLAAIAATILIPEYDHAYAQFGYQDSGTTSADGVESFQVDSGWVPIRASTVTVQVWSVVAASWTISANENTWLYVEVL